MNSLLVTWGHGGNYIRGPAELGSVWTSVNLLPPKVKVGSGPPPGVMVVSEGHVASRAIQI